MSGIFLVINLGIIALFCAMVFFCNKQQRIMLLLAAIYAVIFENLNMLLAGNQVAGYFYHPGFVLFIWDTPLFVILSWAMLIVSSWLIAQRMYTVLWKQILCATLLVLLIDLSIDIFAIRLDFWNWIGYSWHDGFFGVPSANYAGWFLVTIVFLSVYSLWQKQKKIKWIVPIVAYIIFLPLMGLYKVLVEGLALGKGVQIVILFSLLTILFLWLLFSHKKQLDYKDRKIQFSLFLRVLFHMFSLACIVLYGITQWSLVLAFVVFFLLEFTIFKCNYLHEFITRQVTRSIDRLDKIK